MYSRGRSAEAQGIHKTRVQTPCTVETHDTDDLCYSAPLIARMFETHVFVVIAL